MATVTSTRVELDARGTGLDRFCGADIARDRGVAECGKGSDVSHILPVQPALVSANHGWQRGDCRLQSDYRREQRTGRERKGLYLKATAVGPVKAATLYPWAPNWVAMTMTAAGPWHTGRKAVVDSV